MVNIMPAPKQPASTGGQVYNGRPVQSSDLASVDHYAAWLAMSRHPMTPHVLLGGNLDVTTGGLVTGFQQTNTETFTDWRYLELVVPPFCNYLAWGVVCLGAGSIRFNPFDKSASDTYMIKAETELYETKKTAKDMRRYWAKSPVKVPAADELSAAGLSHGVSGCKHPRLMTVRYQINSNSTAAGTYFAVQALLFSFLPTASSTDVSGYATSGGGGTDI